MTYISKIQGRVNLVHHVQWRRLVVMQGEDEGETAQRLLATRQVGYVLPRLLRRHDAEEDALREGVERVDQLQLRIAAHRDHLVHLLQPERDDAEALHEASEAELAQVIATLLGRVTRGDSLLKVGAARCVLFHAAAVLVQDAQVDIDVLRFLLENCNFRLEGVFAEFLQLVFGVLGKLFLFRLFS